MKIQLESGSPSSATHRLTQPSSTLNRRYVSRPTNLVIEEAARSIDTSHSSRTARPSRLVNLRVHDTDLEALRAAEEAKAAEIAEAARRSAEAAAAPVTTHEISESRSVYTPSQFAPQILETYSYPVENTQPEPSTAYPTHEDAADFYSYPAQAIPQDTEPYAYDTPPEPTYTPMALTATTTPPDNSYVAPTENTAIYDYHSTQLTPLDEAASPSSEMLPAPATNATIAQAADVDTRALAMSIAADYTAANLSAAMHSTPSIEATDSLSAAINEQHATKSIDEIAHIASEAIVSIQSTNDPAEIARQIESLQSFATDIKSSSNPEIVELGETIDKFITIASKSTGIKAAETSKKAEAQPTVTLSSKANRAASKVTKSTTKMMSMSATKPATAKVAKPAPRVAKSPARVQPIKRSTPVRPAKHVARPAAKPQLTNDKDAALRKALRSVASMDEDPHTETRRSRSRSKGGVKRFALAFTCAAACVAAIVYFVGSNIPDISVRVAAMQTGIESSYPSYIPRGFSLSDISSENDKITLTFTSSEAGTFTLIEEKSSWDSAALLRNYVEPTWHESYTTTHEQGLTIYMYSSNATWVNGGVLYKINANDNVLTKKQLRNIVTSIQ